MKQVAIFFTLFVFQVQSFAAIQISSSEVSNEEFNAYYETHKELGSSFVDNYIHHNPSPEHTQNINSIFEKAMGYYFARSKSQACELFSQIIDLSMSEDWQDNQRLMIFNAFLRTAELTPEKSEEFLEKAVAFDYKLSPDSGHFSKKIIEDFNKIKISLQKKSFNLQLGEFRKFNKMLLNGRDVELRANTELTVLPGQYRVTFLSDKYKPLIFIFTSQQLMVLNAPTIPFAEGNCESPELSDYFQNLEVSVYYPKCVKDFKMVQSLTKTEALIPASSMSASNSTANSTKFESPYEPIYKKPWFLVATGLIVGFFVVKGIADSQKGSGSSTGPTSQTVSQ